MILEETTEQRRSRLGVALDAVGWTLFFIWLGIIILAKKALPVGVGSIGIGLIVLSGTMVRFFLRVSVSMFWLIIGTIFVAAGVGQLLKIDLPFLPIALIVCGVLLLIHRRAKRRGGKE
ncbi:MAG: hypothetical protein V2A66_03800 [Pseudomonadota bacterium]